MLSFFFFLKKKTNFHIFWDNAKSKTLHLISDKDRFKLNLNFTSIYIYIYYLHSLEQYIIYSLFQKYDETY
jgi:hypothetical protein